MAHSTLAAIMIRMSAYTGQEVTWNQALESEENFVPKEWLVTSPPFDTAIARPGQTKLI